VSLLLSLLLIQLPALLLAFSLALAQTGHYCTAGNIWCLDWIFTSSAQSNDTLNITLTAKIDSTSAKWVAFGLNNVPLMAGAHAIIGWVQPGTNIQTISCRALVGSNGGHDAIPLPTTYATSLDGASNVGGVHVIKFSRPVYLTNNNYGVPNILNVFTHGLWSIGPNAPVNANDNITQHIPSLRGSFSLNFFTGQTAPDFTAAPNDSVTIKVNILLFVLAFMLLR